MSAVTKSVRPIISDWQSSASTVAQRFQKVLELEEWSDCVFLVGSNEPREEFKCHKLVLSSSSPVFETLFYGSLAVKDGEPVIIPDIEPDNFKFFIDYLYSDKLVIPNIQTAEALLYAGKKYLIPDLVQRTTQYLETNLDVYSVLNTLKIAESVGETRLRKHCIRLMCRSRPQCWLDNDLLQGGALTPHTLSELADLLPIPGGEMSLVVIMYTWAHNMCCVYGVESNGVNKRLILEEHDLMKHFRFLHFNPDCFENSIRPLDLLNEDELEEIGIYLKRCENNQSIRCSGLSDIRSPALKKFLHVISPKNILLSNEQMYVRSALSNLESFQVVSNVKCYFESKFRILITGFTMNKLTNLPYAKDPRFHFQLPEVYEDKLSISIKDSTGRVVNHFEFEALKTCFRPLLKINFKDAFWAEPKTKYCLQISAEPGVMHAAACEMATVVDKDTDRIEFRETLGCLVPGTDSDFKDLDGNVGIIAAFCCRSYLNHEGSESF